MSYSTHAIFGGAAKRWLAYNEVKGPSDEVVAVARYNLLNDTFFVAVALVAAAVTSIFFRSFSAAASLGSLGYFFWRVTDDELYSYTVRDVEIIKGFFRDTRIPHENAEENVYWWLGVKKEDCSQPWQPDRTLFESPSRLGYPYMKGRIVLKNSPAASAGFLVNVLPMFLGRYIP